MRQTLPRILIASCFSGGGKTTITCGLLRTWQKRGISLKAWKCGPDYIDPMFHRQVLGIEGGNLDTFFMKPEELSRHLLKESEDCGLAVIEGVMGYYDGMGGISTWGSTYEVAAYTRTPVVMLLDGRGASLSLAAMLRGFLQFRENHQIVGVILNHTKKEMAQRLKAVLEQEGIRTFGSLPDCPEASFGSRHLGLVLPDEVWNLQEKIDRMAGVVEENLDLTALYQAAEGAPALTEFLKSEGTGSEGTGIGAGTDSAAKAVPPQRGRSESGRSMLTIAIAEDEAFCFYYQENKKILEAMGAELAPFSPLRDEKLPEGACGLILGGGYPELHGKELAENQAMQRAIRDAAEAGMPLLAECGGFLYLHERLEDGKGNLYPMAGVIAGSARRQEHMGRFGYVSLTSVEEGNEKEDEREASWLTGEIRGHEFHYWESENCGRAWLARKPMGGKQWKCMHVRNYQAAGFPHLYYPSNPEFIRRWLEGCRAFQSR